MVNVALMGFDPVPDPTVLLDYSPRAVTCRCCGETTRLPDPAELGPGLHDFTVYHADACPVLRFARLNSKGKADTKAARRALRHALAMAQRTGPPS